MSITRQAVVFMLVRDGKLLVEKRRKDKKHLPGVVVIPGGSIEEGETPEQAVKREVEEELGVTPTAMAYLCTLRQRKESDVLLHFYTVNAWTGNISVKEAVDVSWIGLDEEGLIDVAAGRVAVREYRRLHQ